MPLYDFSCKCGNRFDEFIRFDDLKKPVKCPECGENADRLISLPNTLPDLAYNFIDIHTTGKPVPITSKGQWKKHLKKLGMTDDFPQAPPKPGSLKQLRNEPTKEERIEAHKKNIESVLREEGKIR